MPIPKKLARQGGGDLPRNPSHLKKKLVEAVNALPPVIENTSQVSTAPADELLETMRTLLSEHNLCGVLQALTDIMKE